MATSAASSTKQQPTLYQATETMKLVVGGLVLMVVGPYVACQVAMCTFWEWLDKKTINFIAFCTYLANTFGPKFASLTKNKKEDGFIVPIAFFLGFVLPGWFFYELYLCATIGFSWQRVAFYNICRIGPMYMNFMYVYVLCHKEAHNFGNMFSVKGLFFFNYWVGLFHGVLPGVFTITHVHNHHKYDNDENDLHTTAFRPRDEVSSWIRYIPEWFGYASNVSAVIQFCKEKRYNFAFKTALASMVYVLFVVACARVHFWFTMATIVYAFVEANILLSVVNFAWHAFIDPNDPSNDYVNSTTIIDGLNFTMGEELHVVHHQYAGAHWSKHQELYLKHATEYKACLPTAFYKVNIFEVFGLCVGKQYEKLADMYYEPLIPDGMTKKELAGILKQRLQTYGPDIAKRVGRTHKAKALEKEAGKKIQ